MHTLERSDPCNGNEPAYTRPPLTRGSRLAVEGASPLRTPEKGRRRSVTAYLEQYVFIVGPVLLTIQSIDK